MANDITAANGNQEVVFKGVFNKMFHVLYGTSNSFAKLLLCLAFFMCNIFMFAQSPGGVNGVELWSYPQPTTYDLDSTYSFKDVAGDNAKLIFMPSNNTEFRQHRNVMQSFNFHPSLHFNGTDSAQLRINHSNSSQATIIAVLAPDTTKTLNDSIFYRLAGRQEGAIVDSIAATDSHIITNNAATLSHKFLENIDSIAPIKILSYQRATVPLHSVWGEQSHSTLYFGGDNNSFHGYLSELLVYGRELSLLERAKAESYLAIKYGITLHGSYFAPDNSLLWDFSSDSTFRHRISGIARYDESLLNQLVSSSSYDEKSPSYRIENDSFYAHSCYNKPTANRLLVIGREGGSSMPNNSFLIFGDDNGSLSLQESDEDDLWHMIGRKWKVNSNLPTEPNDTIELLTKDINVTTIKNGFYALSRTANSSNSYTMFGPKTSSNLHFGFVVPESMPSFDIGIITGIGNKVEFGYHFDTNGSISIIEQKAIKNTIFTGSFAHHIDIYKKGDDLFLQIDGIGNSVYNIIVPVAKSAEVHEEINPDIPPFNNGDDIAGINVNPGVVVGPVGPVGPIEPMVAYMSGYSCKGIISINSGDSFDLNSLRVDGFRETGNMLELNYNYAAGLKPYRKNRAVLSVLDNEDDLFETGALYPNFEYDVTRNKLIFHNVFFPQNNESFFTFGAYDGLIAEFTPTSATCNNGISLSDGSLRIDIKCGSPLYKCVMTPVAHHIENLNSVNDSLVAQDILPKYMTGLIFGENRYTIDGLRAGEYYLTLQQLGGTNIYASSFHSDTKRTFISQIPTNSSQSDSYGIEWQVTDTISDYQAGLVNTNNSNISNGLRLDGNKCYYIYNGQSHLLEGTITPGDTLSLTRTGNSIIFKCGNAIVLKSISATLKTFKVEFEDSEATLANVKYLNSDSTPDGTPSDESILIEQVRNNSISRTIIIGCGSDSYVEDAINAESVLNVPRRNNSSKINPFNINGSGQSNGIFTVSGLGSSSYRAVLMNETDGPAQLLVFDAAGRLLYESYMTSNGTIKEATFTLPTQGVYVIKAITETEDYSYKLLNQ